jgi:methyltransferase (TIGR00027 family)
VARAAETRRRDPLFRDAAAVALVEALDLPPQWARVDWATQIGIAVRTRLLDDATRRFVSRHPGCVVVNLGAGLCTRAQRVSGDFDWFDLDLPDVVELRQRLLSQGDRQRNLARSAFDRRWMDEIGWRAGRPVLLIAEGVLPYFSARAVRELVVELGQRFPGGELMFEALSPVLVALSAFHPSVGKSGARFHWGISDGRDLEDWSPEIRFVQQWRYLDCSPERWRWLRFARHVPMLRDVLTLVHLRFDGHGG